MTSNENGSNFEYIEDVEPVKTTEILPGTIKKLLLDAQKDTSSRPSSNNDSPKYELGVSSAAPSSRGSASQDQPELEWVWDWSSRPELNPKLKDVTFKHPKPKKKCLSIRNTKLMQKLTCLMDAFPYIFITHAFSFLAGAALVSFIMKKTKSDSVLAML